MSNPKAPVRETPLPAPAEETAEPIRRYRNPLPPVPPPDPVGEDCRAAAEQILETLCRQNQLLLDLLGAVNALTAAVCARKSAECTPPSS